MEQQIVNFIRSIYEAIGWPGVALLMAVESACIPLPSEIIMPLAGWMLVQARGGGLGSLLLLALVGAVGNLLGSLAAYWVGDRGGVPLLRKYGKYVLITNHEIERANHWFNKYGEWIVFLSRLMPGVRTFISLPAGVARMDLKKFSIYSLAGSFPWSFGLAYGGYVLGQNWEKLREAMRPFDLPIVIILVLLVVAFVVWRLRQIRREARAAKETGKDA